MLTKYFVVVVVVVVLLRFGVGYADENMISEMCEVYKSPGQFNFL